jgi:hypothetical protein
LIQASDVADEMQHWQMYRKWNARLFEEMYKAYVEVPARLDSSIFTSSPGKEARIRCLELRHLNIAEKIAANGKVGAEHVAQMVQSLNKDNLELPVPKALSNGLD